MGKALNDAIKNDEERIKIQKMLNESDSKYNYRKKELPLFESLFKMEADEIIEKYVILNHLISNDVKFHLQNDSNPFKVSIFKDIISKKYPETDNILQKFNEINEKYRVILHKTQNFLISRIKNHDSGGRLVYKTSKNF